MLLAWWRGWLGWRAWILVIGVQAALLASGLATPWTGQREEDRVEQVVPERAAAPQQSEASADDDD